MIYALKAKKYFDPVLSKNQLEHLKLSKISKVVIIF